MTRLLFRFPMPPNLSNESRYNAHWGRRHGAKQKYLSVCDAMQNAGLLPAPPAKPFERVTLGSVMRLGGAMDDDNALARHKWVCDWLKTRGYIVEDRKKNIQWAGLPQQIVSRRQAYEIELTLEAA